MQRLPNFFIVGAPKCATTSMDSYLKAHPDIFMSPVKESHFFAHDLYPPDIKCSWQRYTGFFRDAGGERVVGESSVFYMLSRSAAADIKTFCPDARILIMIRNPVDLLASHHSQIVYEGLESERELQRALAREDERRRTHAAGRVTFREKVTHYRDVAALSEQIARFRDAFGWSRMHVVVYDDLLRDLPGVYREVLEFLEVDPSFRPAFAVENANKVVRSPRVRAFLMNTPPWATRLGRSVLPSPRLRHQVRGAIKRFNTRYRPRQSMAPSLRASLARELRPEVERLSRLLDRDLTPWCESAEAPAATPAASELSGRLLECR